MSKKQINEIELKQFHINQFKEFIEFFHKLSPIERLAHKTDYQNTLNYHFKKAGGF